VEPNTLALVLAEDQRPAVLQVQQVVQLDALVGRVAEHPVVEDLAVLVDLTKAAPCGRRPAARWLPGAARPRRWSGPRRWASAPIATESGRRGLSMEPCGLDLVRVPSRDVGEYCPLVRP